MWPKCMRIVDHIHGSKLKWLVLAFKWLIVPRSAIQMCDQMHHIYVSSVLAVHPSRECMFFSVVVIIGSKIEIAHFNLISLLLKDTWCKWDYADPIRGGGVCRNDWRERKGHQTTRSELIKWNVILVRPSAEMAAASWYEWNVYWFVA